jgi:hypothetical protein
MNSLFMGCWRREVPLNLEECYVGFCVPDCEGQTLYTFYAFYAWWFSVSLLREDSLLENMEVAQASSQREKDKPGRGRSMYPFRKPKKIQQQKEIT